MNGHKCTTLQLGPRKSSHGWITLPNEPSNQPAGGWECTCAPGGPSDKAEQKIPEIHAHLLALVQKGLRAQLTPVKDEPPPPHTHTHTHTSV